MLRAAWIFGYGSLMWRPAFRFERREPSYVLGWSRRFWQGSTDHRGVPGAPGRVVTLIPDPFARCFGLAYRVAAPDIPEVLAMLDHREQGGYARHDVPLYFADRGGAPEAGRAQETAIMYVATPENPSYLGPAPLPEMARQVLSSRGPSGPNAEYVLRLAETLSELGAEDEHVTALARHVAALAQR
jgi:glutathione-specific gamma-glutamylcyclotransferase